MSSFFTLWCKSLVTGFMHDISPWKLDGNSNCIMYVSPTLVSSIWWSILFMVLSYGLIFCYYFPIRAPNSAQFFDKWPII